MKRIILVSVLLLVALALFACATPTPETKIVKETVVVDKPVEKVVEKVVTVVVTPPPVPTAVPKVEPTKVVDLNAIQAAYKLSSHSNDWGEGRGPNTYCARCHSPRNWDPKAIPGPPPNCMACKFPTDAAVRKPPPGTNSFIEQKDWKNVGCDVCHQVSAAGVVDPKPVMWNQATGKYDTVATNTELCEKCHLNSLGGSLHLRDVSGPAHLNQIGVTTHRPNQCTDCHNPHSTQAACSNCHGDVFKAKPNTGHIAVHAKVSCQACHDATGMPGMKSAPADPKDPKGQWVTYRLAAGGGGGPPSYAVYTSHSLKKAVDCTRCHYPNNAEGLRSLVTPTATRPPTTPTVPAAAGTPTATPTR